MWSGALARVFTSAAIGFEKPHPQAFHTVLRALGDATTVWVLGDSMTADVTGAYAVGLRAILVRRHHPQAAHYCETLTELPRLLASRERSSNRGLPGVLAGAPELAGDGGDTPLHHHA